MLKVTSQIFVVTLNFPCTRPNGFIIRPGQVSSIDVTVSGCIIQLHK